MSSRIRRPSHWLLCAFTLICFTTISCLAQEYECDVGDVECMAAAEAAARRHSNPRPFEPVQLDPNVYQETMLWRTFLLQIFDTVDKSLDYAGGMKAQEKVIVSEVLEFFDMDPFVFGKKLTRQDGNWLEVLNVRMKQFAPSTFFKVWDENPPTMEEISVIVTIDDQAMDLARVTGGGEDGSTTFIDQDLMIGKAFLPFRHRGYTATLLDTFCRVVLGPLKSVAYAVPSTANLEKIAHFQPLIEVGAGTGYWSAALKELHNVDITPYDEKPPQAEGEVLYFYHTYTQVLEGTCGNIFEHWQDTTDKAPPPPPTLLMVWPNNPDNEDNAPEFHSDRLPPTWDVECLETYIAAGGTTVIYVGEREENIHHLPGKPPESGLCATRKFQSTLKSKFDLIHQMEVPTWYYSDDLTIWQLKNTTTTTPQQQQQQDKESKQEL